MSDKYTEEELLIATQIAYYNFDPAIINELTYENNGYSPTLQMILDRDKQIFDAQKSDPSAYPGIKTIYEERCYLDPNKTSSAYDIERTDAARERYESIKSGEICQGWALADYHNENSTTGLVGCLLETGPNNNGKNGAIIAFRGSESDGLQQVLLDWGISDIGLLSAYETLQQASAEKYTQFVNDYYGDKYDYVATTGHSLGGALSFHSALTAPQPLWEKIVQAYSMDGPGTSDEYLITHADYIARMASRPDVMQHRGWSWVGTLLLQLPCADYKWLQVSDAMSNFLLFKHDTASIAANEGGSLPLSASPMNPFEAALFATSKGIDLRINTHPQAYSALAIDKLLEAYQNYKLGKAQELIDKTLEERDFENEEAIRNYLLEHTGDANPKYLVRGALLHCRCGTHARYLNLLLDHGAYVGEHPLIHELNCETENQRNISWFGVCKSPCPPSSEIVSYQKDVPRDSCGIPTGAASGFDIGHKCMPLIVDRKWFDTHSKTRIVDNGHLDPGDRAIADAGSTPKGLATATTLSYLICKWGGIIEPYNSGQEYFDSSVDSEQTKIENNDPYALSNSKPVQGTSITSPYAAATLNGEPLDEITIKVIELLSNQSAGEETAKYNWDVIEEIVQSDMKNFASEKYKALCYIYNNMSDANDIQRFLNAGFSISQIPEPPKPHTTAEGYSYWYNEQPQYQQAKNRYDYAQPGPVLQGMAAWYKNEEGFDGYSIEDLERINLLRAACEAGGGTYVEKGHKPIQIEQGKNGFLLTVPSQTASPNLHILEVDKSGWSSKE